MSQAGIIDTATAIGAARVAVVMCIMSAGHSAMGGGYGFVAEGAAS